MYWRMGIVVFKRELDVKPKVAKTTFPVMPADLTAPLGCFISELFSFLFFFFAVRNLQIAKTKRSGKLIPNPAFSNAEKTINKSLRKPILRLRCFADSVRM